MRKCKGALTTRLRSDRACEMRDRRTAPSGYRCVMSSTGVVREWRFGDDWGVFDSQDCPGGAYATEQSLRVEAVADLSQPTPSMGLRPGTEVEFEWTEAVEPIKGMRYLVDDAWPQATTTTAPPLHSTRAFSTSLWISVGEPGPDGLTLMRQDLHKAVVAAIAVPRPTYPPLWARCSNGSMTKAGEYSILPLSQVVSGRTIRQLSAPVSADCIRDKPSSSPTNTPGRTGMNFGQSQSKNYDSQAFTFISGNSSRCPPRRPE